MGVGSTITVESSGIFGDDTYSNANFLFGGFIDIDEGGTSNTAIGVTIDIGTGCSDNIIIGDTITVGDNSDFNIVLGDNIAINGDTDANIVLGDNVTIEGDINGTIMAGSNAVVTNGSNQAVVIGSSVPNQTITETFEATAAQVAVAEIRLLNRPNNVAAISSVMINGVEQTGTLTLDDPNGRTLSGFEPELLFGDEVVVTFTGDLVTAVSGEDTLAIGSGAQAVGNNSTVVGVGSQAAGNDTAIFGDNSTVLGSSSISIGNRNFVSGGTSTAIGLFNNVFSASPFGNTVVVGGINNVGEEDNVVESVSVYGSINNVPGGSEYITIYGTDVDLRNLTDPVQLTAVGRDIRFRDGSNQATAIGQSLLIASYNAPEGTITTRGSAVTDAFPFNEITAGDTTIQFTSLNARFDDAETYAPNTPNTCLLYTSPSPRDRTRSRMPSSA